MAPPDITRQTTKVFGIGWAKTGTTTLGKCLQVLGFNHQSQRLDLVQDLARGDLSTIMQLAEEKESFEDWPWIVLYRELDQAFPHSRFILTTRNSKNWIRSYQNMLNNQGEATEELNQIRRTLYGLPFPHVTETQLIERHEQHNAEVAHYFRDRPQDLLIVDWELSAGWRELCQFLGKNIPQAAFPHANKGRYKTGSD